MWKYSQKGQFWILVQMSSSLDDLVNWNMLHSARLEMATDKSIQFKGTEYIRVGTAAISDFTLG